MSDITCAKCGEPWDSYGVRNGDMTPGERKRFLAGEGCPCCRFGTACPNCSGFGVDSYPAPANRCPICHDQGYVYAWSPRQNARGYKADGLYAGYTPNVVLIDEAIDLDKTMGVRKLPERQEAYQSADGWVDQWVVACPHYCKPEKVCPVCNGTGELHVEKPDEVALAACRSELDNSDEEPISIMARRGL